jgi:hypothetical protein
MRDRLIPKLAALRYLLEYKANIFVRNFNLSTKYEAD